MKGSFVRNTLAACTLAFAAAGAQAAIVNTWDYTISLNWKTSGTEWNSSSGGSQENTSTVLSWGADGGDYHDNNKPSDQSRSALVIDPSNTDGSVTTYVGGGQPPAAYFESSGTVTHYNNTLAGTFKTLKKAVMKATVDLTPTDPAGDALPTFSYDFDINFIETSNSTPCGFPSSTVCDDIFVIDIGSLNKQFTHAGQTYFVSIVGLLDQTSNPLDTLDPSACAKAEAAAGCVGFLTLEKKVNAANFLFAISTEELCTGGDCNPTIPEPGTLVLMGLGLVGLRSLRRRS